MEPTTPPQLSSPVTSGSLTPRSIRGKQLTTAIAAAAMTMTTTQPTPGAYSPHPSAASRKSARDQDFSGSESGGRWVRGVPEDARGLPDASVKWQPDGLTMHTKKWFLKPDS